MLECLVGQASTLIQREAITCQPLRDPGVVCGIYHHGHEGEVLGSGAYHGRAAYVDVLQRVIEGNAGPRDGCGKRVQVDGHHVDRLHAQTGKLFDVAVVIAPG